VADVGEREAEAPEAFEKGREIAGRAAVEERRSIVRLHEVAADDALGAEVMEVDQVDHSVIFAKLGQVAARWFSR
jgi:hypothetical protein